MSGMHIAVAMLEEDAKTPADNTHGFFIEVSADEVEAALNMGVKSFEILYVEYPLKRFLEKEKERRARR